MPEKITFDCAVCAESFGNETDLNTHSLFTHNVYRGYCSTNSSSMNEKTATSVSDGIMKCLESLYRYILPEHISNQYDHIIVEFGYNKRYQKLNQKQKLEVKAKYVHDRIRNELDPTWTGINGKVGLILMGLDWLSEHGYYKIVNTHSHTRLGKLVDFLNTELDQKQKTRFIKNIEDNMEYMDYNYSPANVLGIKKPDSNDKQTWLFVKSKKDVGFTIEIEFISECLFGKNDDYAVKETYRRDVLKRFLPKKRIYQIEKKSFNERAIGQHERRNEIDELPDESKLDAILEQNNNNREVKA